MAVNYKFIDDKIGLSSGGAVPPTATTWTAGTVYAAKAVVQSGGFLFTTTAGGTAGANAPTPLVLSDGGVTWTLLGAVSSLCASDATQQQEIGYIALGRDDTYGLGEFIYVKFTGTTNPGDLVKVDRFNKTCTQSGATNGAGVYNVYGLSMGAQASGTFGWVMIRGIHDGANVDGGAVVGTVPSGTAFSGRLGVAGGVVNYVLDGMVSRVLGVAGRGTVELYWPSCSGR